MFGIELVHAGIVFPGTREDAHGFMAGKGYEYVGTIGEFIGDRKVNN